MKRTLRVNRGNVYEMCVTISNIGGKRTKHHKVFEKLENMYTKKHDMSARVPSAGGGPLG